MFEGKLTNYYLIGDGKLTASNNGEHNVNLSEPAC